MMSCTSSSYQQFISWGHVLAVFTTTERHVVLTCSIECLKKLIGFLHIIISTLHTSFQTVALQYLHWVLNWGAIKYFCRTDWTWLTYWQSADCDDMGEIKGTIWQNVTPLACTLRGCGFIAHTMFLRYGVVKDSGTLMSQVRLVTRGITNFFTYSWRSLSQILEYPLALLLFVT